MVVMVVHRFCSQMIQCQQLIGGLDFLLWTQALPWGIHLRMAYPRKAGFGAPVILPQMAQNSGVCSLTDKEELQRPAK